MSDHGAHGANDGAHGHGANEALGPIDVRAWLAGAIGVAIGLLTVAVIAAASTRARVRPVVPSSSSTAPWCVSMPSAALPGAIATPIWDKLEILDFSPFNGTIYESAAHRMQAWAIEHGRRSPPSSRVAAAVTHALTARKAPTRISVVKNWWTDYLLPPLLPTRLSDWLVARWLGFDKLRAVRQKETTS